MLYFDNYHKNRLKEFTHNIWDSIDRFKQTVWIVKQIKSIKCGCVNHETLEALNSCKRCLGTGNKIKIYQAECVLKEDSLEDNLISKKAYFKYGTIQIDHGDYIVDLEDIYSVYTKQYIRGEHGEPTAIKCVCPHIKMDSKIILKNFKEIIEKYGYKLQ